MRSSTSLLDIGDVAFQDIHAPRTFSYESQILTEEARTEAEKSVQPVYLPADPSITRKQVEKLRVVLNYISAIRSDIFATLGQKIEDLQKISDLKISGDVAETILSLDDARWAAVQEESLYLLEQVMRNSIREDQIANMQRNLSTQISFDFSDSESEIINDIVSQLITANSLYSNDATSASIETARSKVEPVIKKFVAGEIIVSSGEVIDPLDWEALQELGYTEPKNKALDYISAGLITVVILIYNVLYIRRIRQTSGKKIQDLPVIAITFLLFLFTAKLIIPNHTILPYLFPVAAFGLAISSLYDYETGLIFSISLSILAAFNEGSTVDLAFYYFLPTSIGIFVLGRGRRITTFFMAGLAIGLSGAAMVISYRLLNSYLDFTGVSTLIGAAFINGFGSVSLTLIIQFILSQVTGKVTALQLMDLARPDHPLLQELLLNAPGSYQHSLQVSNLAEQAAKMINCDALLTRVGALYHDVGKLKNPQFFIENQPVNQINTHDKVNPVLASKTIVKHVEDGLQLAQQYNLPPQIRAFIREHHATSLTRYQYNMAVKKAGSEDKVDAAAFRYPGPNPASKETALLMMADGCEARVRAESPKNVEEIAQIVDSAIDHYLNRGFLSQTDLTLNDLRLVKQSFVKTLKNTYHQRIKYPENPVENEKTGKSGG
ncbi:MAG: HDIG domain-containing protein [Anaerolineae bacterium]|nr:HDIG domain-containing protein [Anaerolineae bacterium]